jgi:hypothetical protein
MSEFFFLSCNKKKKRKKQSCCSTESANPIIVRFLFVLNKTSSAKQKDGGKVADQQQTQEKINSKIK